MTQSKYLPVTWFHPATELRSSPVHGKGNFATALIRAGEKVLIWGGDVYTREELRTVKLDGEWSYSIIDEDLYIFAPQEGRDYFINHSCEPNVWMADEVTVVARRDIQPGEEIVGDYAVWDCEAASHIADCQCGTALCRTTISGLDWQRPELQERYKGHFLPFLSRRFAALSQAE